MNLNVIQSTAPHTYCSTSKETWGARVPEGEIAHHCKDLGQSMAAQLLACPGAPSKTTTLFACGKPVGYNFFVGTLATSTGWSEHLCGNGWGVRGKPLCMLFHFSEAPAGRWKDWRLCAYQRKQMAEYRVNTVSLSESTSTLSLSIQSRCFY